MKPKQYLNVKVRELTYIKNELHLNEVHYMDMSHNRFCVPIKQLVEVRVINEELYLLIDTDK